MIIESKKCKFYMGFHSKFQGFGFIISFDNPFSWEEFYSIDFKFLWLKSWFIYFKQSN